MFAIQLERTHRFSRVYQLFQGIFVSSVDNQSDAHGIVRAMDKILDVNGIDFTKISLADARNILAHCGSNMNIMVSRMK